MTLSRMFGGFINLFSRRATGSQVGKTFCTELLYKQNVPEYGQTRQAETSSQLVNLPGARPLMKPPACCIYLVREIVFLSVKSQGSWTTIKIRVC